MQRVATQRPGNDLCDRGDELARLNGFLASARSGEGRLVLVEGPAGIGKTALVRAIAGLAREGGVTVTVARATPLEADLPFGVVRQLIAPHAIGDEQLLTGPAALAATLIEEGDTGARDAGGHQGVALLHAFYWVVAGLAERGPLLLVIDDMHWADPPSLRFLRFLLARLDELPVLVLAALRPPDGEQRDPNLEEMAADVAVELLEVSPLGRSGVRELLRRALNEAPEDDLVEACRVATGGNPFFVRELAREMATSGGARSAASIAEVGPSRIARWAAERLRRLPVEALALARAVAVLGADAELRLAARLADVAPGAAAEMAGRLVRAGLLENARPLRFSHAIVGNAIYREMPETERARLHGAGARLLMAEGAEHDRVAGHLLRAERLGDAELVSLLESAGRRALARAPEVAAVYLRRALEEPAPEESAVRILSALAEAEVNAGQAVRAERRLRDALPRIAPGPERVDVVVAYSRALAHQARFAEATRVLEEELSNVGDEFESRLRLETEAAYTGALSPDSAERTGRRLERYADLPPTSRLHRGALVQLARVWSVHGRRERVIGIVRRAIEPGLVFGADGLDMASWIAGFSLLLSAEEREVTQEVAAVAIEDVRAHVAPLEYTHVMATIAGATCLFGDVSAAEAQARSAVAVAAEHGWSQMVPVGHARLIQFLILRGALEEADDLLRREALDGPLPEGFFTTSFALTRGALRLAQGRMEEAVRDLRSVLPLEESAGPAGRIIDTETQLALALAQIDPAEAKALALRRLDRARRWGSPGFVGRATATLGVVEGGDAGIALLREACRLLESSPLVVDLARARLELGGALRRANLRREAREHLLAAGDLAARSGALALADRAQEELRASGSRPRNLVRTGPDALTAMERRIASMAATGMSNPQIAHALFVTRKNVEMHLSRAYSKLDIRSRDELATALGDSPLQPP